MTFSIAESTKYAAEIETFNIDFFLVDELGYSNDY